MTVKSAVTFALMAGLAAGLAVALVAPAEAAHKQRRLAAEQPTRTIYYTPSGRRIVVVTPRSYLDPGTEVMPGERKYSDYALPPGGGSGYAAYPDHNDWKGSWTRMPFPSCWDLGNCSGYGY